jgi:hypothetical protein
MDQGDQEINDRDAIGVDDRETSTHDLEDFILQQGIKKFIEKECQVEGLIDVVNRGIEVTSQKLGILVSKETETDSAVELPVRKRRLTIIEEDEVDGVSSPSDDASEEEESEDEELQQ